jgi:DNA-directed RNA polymerase specialized sigma24 family protein
MNALYDAVQDDVAILTGIDIATAVSQLPQRQQVVMALRISGYTQQSITDLLGISRTTIWSDEKEAKIKLGELLFETIEVGKENLTHAK